MPPERSRLAELRALCVEHGIYVISHLDLLDKVEPGISQAELSRRAGLSTSGTGQIVSMFVLNELIVCNPSEEQFRPSNIALTERGREFISSVRRVLDGGPVKEPEQCALPAQ